MRYFLSNDRTLLIRVEDSGETQSRWIRRPDAWTLEHRRNWARDPDYHEIDTIEAKRLMREADGTESEGDAWNKSETKTSLEELK